LLLLIVGRLLGVPELVESVPILATCSSVQPIVIALALVSSAAATAAPLLLAVSLGKEVVSIPS